MTRFDAIRIFRIRRPLLYSARTANPIYGNERLDFDSILPRCLPNAVPSEIEQRLINAAFVHRRDSPKTMRSRGVARLRKNAEGQDTRQ